MFTANITFRDGSMLKDVHLYKESRLWTSIIIDKEEANKLLNQWSTIHFGNGGIQGHFIPQHIESYELVDLSEEELSEYRNQKLLKEIEKENN